MILKHNHPNNIGWTLRFSVEFFNIISKTCSVISSSMDQYIKIKKQKNIFVLGRESMISSIRDMLSRNEMICVYGSVGVGKTHVVKAALQGLRYYEMTSDVPINVKDSTCHVFVDNVDMDSITWKQFLSNGSLSKGGTIFITKNIKHVDFCDCIKVEPLSHEEQLRLLQDKYPNKDPTNAISMANGNLRDLFMYMEGSDEKDLFVTPKELIYSFLTPSDFHPKNHIGDIVGDHGYSCAVVQENYISSNLSDFSAITEDFSMADVYDTAVYNGDWDLLPYFCHHGIIIPCIGINQSLLPEGLRPGSYWSKYNNLKMRQGKLKEIKHRTGLTMDELLVLKTKCIHNPEEALEHMRDYNMIPQDVDIMNHISLVTKIKPKVTQSLKRCLSGQASIRGTRTLTPTGMKTNVSE